MVIKKHIEQRQPQLGDTRWVKRFALLPKRINDDELIWMCWYEKQQSFEEVKIDSYEGVNLLTIKWTDIKTKDGYLMIKFQR